MVVTNADFAGLPPKESVIILGSGVLNPSNYELAQVVVRGEDLCL